MHKKWCMLLRFMQRIAQVLTSLKLNSIVPLSIKGLLEVALSWLKPYFYRN